MSRPATAPAVRDDTVRLRVAVRGAVQGVGFRPFVFRLAGALDLEGWVSNSASGVLVEVEGPLPTLGSFLSRIAKEGPARSYIQGLESSFLDAVGYRGFEIRESDDSGAKTALILPDIATCPECLSEVLDPDNRRYLYPFTNCTNCGPRFSIIKSLPYDRARTTMSSFTMCGACRIEYENPLDRRFHAQPIACPACGPQLELWDPDGNRISGGHDALLGALGAVRQGLIVAVKGLGGFHLIADARSDMAVRRLRERKHREQKPFAVMYPSASRALDDCILSEHELRLLTSPECPIVLVRKQPSPLADPTSFEVAPGNPYLGVMLPYTPLHHLLLGELRFPVVATSGNLSDEPICTDERDALHRLAGIADCFLVHNRPIARHVDDSVVRVVMDREVVIRRARGYAPLPISPECADASQPTLAVGGHLKNTVALSVGRDIFVSQHIGDLETWQSFEAFREVIGNFGLLHETMPKFVACDAHPDYLSTDYARQSGLEVIPVQHHYAHVLSCVAENEIKPPLLGIAWDGTGYGSDGTIWGGEFLRISPIEADRSDERDTIPFQRVAHIRTFRLPGGDAAVREPRRSALGLLFELLGDEGLYRGDLAPVRSFSSEKRRVIQGMLRTGTNAPFTSSAGRLFDAISSIIGLRHMVAFEGQAAMELEFALSGLETDARFDFELVIDCSSHPHRRIIVDWEPMVRQIIDSRRSGASIGEISVRFHNTLVEAMVAVATRVGEERVALTGGCFQNRYLTERAVRALKSAGFRPYWHQRIPPNDGGLAVGQTIAAFREVALRRSNRAWRSPRAGGAA
jgi:hydrogenase maturation protein HypF